jgi:hypothetical protein
MFSNSNKTEKRIENTKWDKKCVYYCDRKTIIRTDWDVSQIRTLVCSWKG